MDTSSPPRPSKKPRFTFLQTEPAYGDAFEPERWKPAPPEPSAPLKDAPRIIFVPAKCASTANFMAIVSDQAMLDIAAKNATESPLLRLDDKVLKKILTYACSTDEVIEFRSRMPDPIAVVQDTCDVLTAPQADTDMLTASQNNNDVPISTTASDDFIMLDAPAPTPSPILPTLLTSRALHKHTSLLPFTNNTFYCTNTWDLRQILRRMSPAQRSAIKTLKIRWHTARSVLNEAALKNTSFNNSETAFGMLTGLEELVIEGPRGCMSKWAKEKVVGEVVGWVDGVLEGVRVGVEGEEGVGAWLKGGLFGDGWGKEKDKKKGVSWYWTN